MPRPPRVALVVPGFAMGGGVPAVAEFLYTAMEQSGRFEPSIVSVATTSWDAQSVRLASPGTWLQGVRVLQDRWHGKPFHHVGCRVAELEFMRLRPRPALTRILDEHDLVQVVAGSPAWAAVAQRARPPVLLQVATLVSEERKAKFARGVDPWRRLMTSVTSRLDRRALENVRTVFVENGWMLERLGSWMGPSRVTFAPPGIDTELFRPGEYRADGPILSVGRFDDPRKNLPMLLRAYDRLRRSRRHVPRLVLAGSSGPGPADRSLLEDLGLSESVVIEEGLTKDRLAALYREASIFVLTSFEEGLGLVALEAMASAIPVVCTRCGGPETSVEEGLNGHLVSVGQDEELAVVLGRMLDDPEGRRAMGIEGRRIAEERFSLKGASRPFFEEYDRVLEISAC